jgi:hypothetical protein
MNNNQENILKKHFKDNIIYRTASLYNKTTPQNQKRDINLKPNDIVKEILENQPETNPTQSSQDDINTFILISNDNATTRYDFFKDEEYLEELDNSKADFSSLKTFFTDHEQSVDTAIGKVQNIRFDSSSQLLADVKFSSIPKAQEIKTKYDEGVLTDVSIGYKVNDFIVKSTSSSSLQDNSTISSKSDESIKHILVTDYEIVELSAVWRGADRGSIKIKSEKTISNKNGDNKKEGEVLYDITEFEQRLKNIKK